MPLIGKAMYDNFVQDRFEKCATPLSDIIPKPHTYTFRQPPPVNLPKLGNKTSSYKCTAAVVTQMFISLQARPDSNMAEFFVHENAREPPSLSDKGKLRTGTKSRIRGCLPSMSGYGQDPTPQQASVVILDMAAVTLMVRGTRAKVLGEYTSMHLLPFMESQKTPHTTKIDAARDCYHKHSLKNQTHKTTSRSWCPANSSCHKDPNSPMKGLATVSVIQPEQRRSLQISIHWIYQCYGQYYSMLYNKHIRQMLFQINPLICAVLARQTTRRLTAGWYCIFSMLSWLVIRWHLSTLLAQML